MREIKVAAFRPDIDKIITCVEEMLEDAGCPMKTVFQINTVIDEVFTNIADYAYGPKGGEATVRIEILPEPRRLWLEFSDAGIPFDPLAKEDPDVTLSAEERTVGGLGIFLVKKLMDKVGYAYSGGRNVLTMEKAF